MRRIRNFRPRPKDAPKDWLDFDRRYKEDVKGMTDLWDPVRRTEVCASCHVGNYKEQKIITHAMYAAGHPPLPSFEPASFSEFQPRHWQYLREKAPAQQARLQPFDPANLEHAQLVATSGPVLLRMNLTLLADQARANKDDPPGALWPDFARYDCRACHHDLTSNAPAHNRTGSTAPGRPGESKWASVLTRLGISVLTTSDESAKEQRSRYESLDREFRQAMTAEPFGNRDHVIAAAEKLANWADQLIKNRSHAPVHEEKAWKLIVELCDEFGKPGLDYDSARQAAWAFRAIYYDLPPASPKRAKDKDIKAILDQLDSLLMTNLRRENARTTVEQSLKSRLETSANYNPADGEKLFAQLKALVDAL